MEHTFSGSDRDLSSNFNIDWEIDFSSQSWSLHIDDTDSFNSFNFSTVLDNID